MDSVAIILEELQREKELLLLKIEKNNEELLKIEKKILYYSWVYKNNLFYFVYYDDLIKSYKTLNLKQFEDFVSDYIKTLKAKQKEHKKESNIAKKCKDYFMEKYLLIQSENLESEARIYEIELQIEDIKNPPKKMIHIIERGNEND